MNTAKVEALVDELRQLRLCLSNAGESKRVGLLFDVERKTRHPADWRVSVVFPGGSSRRYLAHIRDDLERRIADIESQLEAL